MRKTLVLAAALLCVVAGAVVATAAIPDANGVIHGCRNTKTGALRVIDTDKGQTCVKDEASLAWSQTGPQGSAGPAGPQGPAGVSGYVVINQVTVVPANSQEDDWSATASCPAGKQVLGGGAAVNAGVDWAVGRSAPVFDGSQYVAWIASMHRLGPPETSISSVVAWAVCATTT